MTIRITEVNGVYEVWQPGVPVPVLRSVNPDEVNEYVGFEVIKEDD